MPHTTVILVSSLISLVALTALASPPDVAVRPLEGEGIRGSLQSLSAEKVIVVAAGGPTELALGQIMWLELSAVSPANKPTIWLELLDGSRLLATAYTSAAGTAQITMTTGQMLELPARSVQSVRFNPQSPELAVQWREISSSMASGDTLVIRKTSTRTVEQGDDEPRTVTEQALDQLEGTVLAVAPDMVRFELDGEKVDVRREKLEGVVYYHSSRREFAAAVCRLVDSGGSVWRLSEIQFADERFRVTTLGGQPLEFPAASVAKLDFSVGNVSFLTDMEADTGAGESNFSLQPSAMAYKFSRVFQVRPAPPLGAEAFRMSGEKFENGLSIHSPARLTYRVPAGFRKFSAIAGVDDTLLAPGRFALVVLADGKEVARHAFSDQQRKPIPLTLDVSQIRRLSIVLESGEGQDFGDQLNLCDARFTK